MTTPRMNKDIAALGYTEAAKTWLNAANRLAGDVGPNLTTFDAVKIDTFTHLAEANLAMGLAVKSGDA